MITVGKHPSTLVHGDGYPASFYIGDKMVAGYEEKTVTGDGVAGTETQYNGNIPSAVIQGVGRQETLTGKNLSKGGSAIRQTGKISITFDGRDTVVDGTGYFVYETIYVKDPAPVTMSLRIKSIEGTFTGAYTPSIVWYYKGGGHSETNVEVLSPGLYSVTLGPEPEKTVDRLEIRPVRKCDDTSTMHVVYSDLQLEYGTVATPYEPYCGGIPAPNPDYPIEPEFLENANLRSIGSNLSDLSDITVKLPTAVTNPLTGEIKSENTKPWGTLRFRVHVPTMKEVFLTADVVKENPANVQLSNFGLGGSQINIHIYDASTNSTNTKEHKELTCSVYRGAAEGLIYAKGVRVGTKKDTVYEPFFNGGTVDVPILRSLPDPTRCDEYDAQTGVLTRKIYELVCTGAEPWQTWGLDKHPELVGLYLYPEEISTDITMKANCELFCNKFASAGQNNWGGVRFGVWGNTKYISIGVYQYSLNNPKTPKEIVDNFKAMLKKMSDEGNPFRIWYPLAEPIIEQYDPAKLKQHPGYTQLIQQGGFAPAPVKGTFNVKKE